LAILSFVALFFINLPFPIVVISSAILGALYSKFFNHQEFETPKGLAKPPLKQTLKTLFTWLGVWAIPIIIVLLIYGPKSTFHSLNIFFSQMSLVTFGGAYAALSYVAQQGVDVHGWLQSGEMLDGLALAETTPGPLIQVVQYVGFMGAYRFPDGISPLLSAFWGSVLTTWMTFAPCFLFIFTLAPYVEFIRGQKILTDALNAITACIVGVILNLSLWFVLKSLFLKDQQFDNGIFRFDYPQWSSIDFGASAICVIALLMQFQFKKGLFTILGTCTVLGILVKTFF
jgi:chromate transporter